MWIFKMVNLRKESLKLTSKPPRAAFYLTKDVENFFDKQMAQRFAAVYGETEYKKFW